MKIRRKRQDRTAVGRTPPAKGPTARETALAARIAELEAELRARDDFLAIAAHELRNPMTPISARLELLLVRARHAAITDCAMLLLTGVTQSSAEHTLADGVIELQTKFYGRHAERVPQVHKLRGSGYPDGATLAVSLRGVSSPARRWWKLTASSSAENATAHQGVFSARSCSR